MIGDIIRKYRIEAGLTQEEMGRRLGVTTPAVNKWEKNNTQPDISLLAPIARLLGITTDTLLSFKNTLTAEEISQWVKRLDKDLENMEYEAVFEEAEKKLAEYPSCYQLIWQTAVIMDASRLVRDVPEKEKYLPTILHWYERCLESEDEELRSKAVGSLFAAYVREEQYEKAESYIPYLSKQNPEYKRMQAEIYYKTGRTEEAYRAYEELLFSGYEQSRMYAGSLYMLYMEDGDHTMARHMNELERKLAAAFEMGKYHEVSVGLDLAAAEKNVAETERIMRGILESIDHISDFTKTPLYQHMTWKKTESSFTEKLRQDLIESFADEETFGYMKGNAFWKKIRTETC